MPTRTLQVVFSSLKVRRIRPHPEDSSTMVKRTAAPKGRKRPRKGDDAAEEDVAGFSFLDDDEQQKQQQSEEEDEEQQETAEQKRMRLGELLQSFTTTVEVKNTPILAFWHSSSSRLSCWIKNLQQQPCCQDCCWPAQSSACALQPPAPWHISC